ncbi:hypothetical protein ACFV3R_33050 [Streptomyces sp. NPDC059740]|uniref:hypothetical protein n=1 Tax=Streptomyces sp. NPDC059740 TaxID=3346926 RepID=UPI003649A5AA
MPASSWPLLWPRRLAGSTPRARTRRAPPPSRSTAGEGKSSGLTLRAAVAQLPTGTEHRSGYEREKFHLWDDADHDQYDTRKEVLLAKAVTKPRQGAHCRLTGGEWSSYYDGKTFTEASRLDIDHVVPLAESWDLGASKW